MWNKDIALRFTVDYLRSKFAKGVLIADRNKFGHAFIKTQSGSFYWLFKKDFFHSFQYEFPNYSKQVGALKGLGESINNEYLKFCLNNRCILLFSYENQERAIYTPSKQKLVGILGTLMPEADLDIPAVALLKIFCDYYNLKRTQDRQNTYKLDNYSESEVVVNEQTYSFPVELLERFKL